jgi:hypothetical protein
MIDFESVGEISYACSALVCVCYNYDFMSSIDEFGRELVDVAFYSSGLGKEEIADHCDIVRHCGESNRPWSWPSGQHDVKGEGKGSLLDVKEPQEVEDLMCERARLEVAQYGFDGHRNII